MPQRRRRNSKSRYNAPSLFYFRDRYALRACEILWSVSKIVNNLFHCGWHLRPKKSNTNSGDDIRTTCCFFLGRKSKQLWEKLFTVFDTDRFRIGGEGGVPHRLHNIFVVAFGNFALPRQRSFNRIRYHRCRIWRITGVNYYYRGKLNKIPLFI